MNILPEVTLKTALMFPYLYNDTGNISNSYAPFQNLLSSTVSSFTTNQLNFDLEHPVDILVLDAYDGAINLILNDGKNQPRLINSRFAVLDNNTFLIPDHVGFEDTNIYDVKTFNIDTQLKSICTKIPKVIYEGLYENSGNVPCGSYTFYFKLCDADNNETEIVAESGIVQCHIGEDCNPKEMRMGMLNENSKKAVKFKLTDIDKGFNYVKVYYVRHSSDNALALTTTYHKIEYKYPIAKDGTADITITGEEQTLDVDYTQFYTNYADIESVLTQELYNNVLLFGNVKKQVHDWQAIQEATWKIVPSIVTEPLVGNIDSKYNIDVNDGSSKGCFYNTLNVYSKVGYWRDEIYRFGVVYIFEDNSLSPVFNILGIDFTKLDALPQKYGQKVITSPSITDFIDPEGAPWENSPTNCIFNKKTLANSKGVIKFPSKSDHDVFPNISTNNYNPRTTYIRFNFDEIGLVQIVSDDKTFNNPDKKNIKLYPIDDEIGAPKCYYRDFDGTAKNNFNKYESAKSFFRKHKIKGLFFVRQKRIPTILCQGIAVNLLDKDRGSIPFLNNVESFLNNRMLSESGSFIEKDKIDSLTPTTTQALFIPDAEMNEATYNSIFTSSNFSLTKVGKGIINNENKRHAFLTNFSTRSLNPNPIQTKLTNVPENTVVVTDGVNYFSTKIGSELEATKVKNCELSWKFTLPQNLTKSSSYIRGQYGAFVGSSEPLEYGAIYNIKLDKYNVTTEEEFEKVIELEFQERFNTESAYHAITDRFNIDKVITKINEKGYYSPVYVSCFRGDCFFNMFTHRMNRNFIDPELPTNTTIIDPACWARNFLVLATAYPLLETLLSAKKTPPGFGFDSEFKNANDWNDYLSKVQANCTNKVYTRTKEYGISNKVCDIWECKNTIAETTPETTTQKTDGVETKTTISYDIAGGVELKGDNTVSQAPGLPIDVPENLNRVAIPPKDGQEGPEIMGINIKALFKSSKNHEVRGVGSINRADVNAVGMGQWFTFPICSNYNYALRDIDFNNATEEAMFMRKRSFYPILPMNIHNPLRDSNVINSAASVSIPKKEYYSLQEAPFIKQEFFTRIIYSMQDDPGTYKNELKMIYENMYADYTKVHGSITKLCALNNYLYIIFKHGIGVVNLTELLNSTNFPYKALTDNVTMLSDKFGSLWKDSIYNTGSRIYGIDSVAKVIWCITNNLVIELSDITAGKVGKWLIDNLDMSEFNLFPYVGHINIKTHYNAYKKDVIFTYYNDEPLEYNWEKVVDPDSETRTVTAWNPAKQIWDLDTSKYEFNPTTRELTNIKTNLVVCNHIPVKKWKKGKQWSLCYNEDFGKFVTFYDWYPLESANIDNIHFSFDRDQANDIVDYAFKEKVNTSLFIPKMYYNSRKSIGKLLGTDETDTKWSNEDIIKGHLSYKTKKHTIDEACTNETELYFIEKNCGILDVNFEFNLQLLERTLYAFCIYVQTDKDLKLMFSNNDGYINKTFTINGSSDYQFIPIFFTVSNSALKQTLKDGFKIIIDTKDKEFDFCDAKLIVCDTEENSFYKECYDKLYQLNDPDDLNKSEGYTTPTLLYYCPGNKIDDKDYIFLRDSLNNLKLWKHGQGGVYDNQCELLPTNWYGKQHEFNFEFVVNHIPHILKIFNNLQIISNKTEPGKFEFEVVGESYMWQKYKPLIQWLRNQVEKNPKWEKKGGNGDYIYENNDFIKVGDSLGDYKQIEIYSDENPKKDWIKADDKKYIYNDFNKEYIENKKGTFLRYYRYEYVGWIGDYNQYYEYKINNDSGEWGYDTEIEDYIKYDSNNSNIIGRYDKKEKYEYVGPGKGSYINTSLDTLCKKLLSKTISELTNEYQDFPVLDFVKDKLTQIPYIDIVLSDKKGLASNDKTYTKNHKWKDLNQDKNEFSFNCGDTVIVEDTQLNEYRVRTEQLGNNINKYGRIRGNQQYLEDIWKVEIRPISFVYVSLNENGELKYSNINEARLRDKYIKIKVRYSGEDLAVILQILTLYERSYA